MEKEILEKLQSARNLFIDLQKRYRNAHSMIELTGAEFPEVNERWPGLELGAGMGGTFLKGFLFAHHRASTHLSLTLVGIDPIVNSQIIEAVDAFKQETEDSLKKETDSESKYSSGLSAWCEGAFYCYSKFAFFMKLVENQYDDIIRISSARKRGEMW